MKNFLPIFILSLLLMVSSNGYTQGNNEGEIKKEAVVTPVKKTTRSIDSLTIAVNQTLLQTQQIVKKNIKEKEKDQELSEKIEKLKEAPKITQTEPNKPEKLNRVKPDNKKDSQVVRHNKVIYKPTKLFKGLTVDYDGQRYYVVKDSTCTNYRWKSIFSKKQCIEYDYYLTIKQ